MSDEKTTAAAVVKEGKIYPDVKPGAVVKVYEKIWDVNPKGEERQRIQIFEGTVLARKHGKGIQATITVRKVTDGIGVEKIYPLSSPAVDNIEVVKQYQVRRAKLGHLRTSLKRMKEVKKTK